MTDRLFSRPLFRFSVLQSLTAINCLGCMYVYGTESCLHVATASATFILCSMGDLAKLGPEEA